ncbi:MAG: ROK family protein [Treponema sp.]|nr:ROK family protein [Treponema sp.]
MHKDLGIGIDVGATKIKCGVVDEQGSILATRTMESWRYTALEDNIKLLISLVKELLEGFDIRRFNSIGAGLPGTVDDARGVVVYTPNLHWNDLVLAPVLEGETGLAVRLVQDTAAAVWGEYLFGAGRGLQNVVCATVGSGIACGIIINGELYGGASHTAGEIGHIHIEDDPIECACGNTGCLEARASGRGLVKLFMRGIERGGHTELTRRLSPDQIDAPAIFAAAGAGDTFCAGVIDEMVRYLAKGLAATAVVLAPDAVIISGGLSSEEELLFKPLTRYFYHYAYRSVRSHVRLELAQLGADAPLIGASALYRARGYQGKR